MKPEIRLWTIRSGKLVEMAKSKFADVHKEKDLEDWVEQNPSLLGRNITMIGRQVYIPKVGLLDLLAIDDDGQLVIVEFKRDQSTRDTIAQILDYASAVRLMTLEQIRELANVNASELDEVTDFDPDPAMILVAAQADDSAERIVDYLASKAKLSIEVVTFTYATSEEGQEILARSILTPDAAVPAVSKTATKITREDLFGIAEERQVLEFVQALHKVSELGWSVEMFLTNGGKVRYWVKLPTDGSWRVLFGVYVGGEKFNTPKAQLDVWVRPEVVFQFSGAPVDKVVDDLHKFEIINETQTAIVLRLKDNQTFAAFYSLLQKWITMSKEVAAQQPEVTQPEQIATP
jgi:hypothetical protein